MFIFIFILQIKLFTWPNVSMPDESLFKLSKSNACLSTGLMFVKPIAFKFLSSLVKIVMCSFQPTFMLVGGSSNVSNMYRSLRAFSWSRPRIFSFFKIVFLEWKIELVNKHQIRPFKLPLRSFQLHFWPNPDKTFPNRSSGSWTPSCQLWTKSPAFYQINLSSSFFIIFLAKED